jgi:hypothetical protein
MKFEIVTHTAYFFKNHVFHVYYPSYDEELNTVFNFIGLLSSGL